MKKNIDLLHEPILPALTRLALPIMATSLVQMAYNMTDMAWIGRVGAGAVSAVGSAAMFTWFSQGVSSLARMGGQVKVAHSLGRGDQKEAGKYAQGALQLGILFAVIFGVISVVFRRPLIGFFNMQDRQIVRDAEIYLTITCGLIIFSFLNTIFTGILTASGDSRTPFVANVIGLVINMILDPFLIFGTGPIPAMGAAGAAIATVGAQAVVTAVFLWFARRDTLVFSQVHILERTGRRYIRQIIKKAAWIMAAWGLGSSALLIFGAEPVFRIFIHEPEVVADGIIYLQVLGLSQMFMCEEILTEGALAGLGKTMQASVISVIFTAARIPLALLLSATALGLSGIWWAITLTSVVKGFVFVGYFVTVMRKLPPERETCRQL